MIVPCECGAKLKIDDAKIAGKGVKVRCPRCGTVLSVQKQKTASTSVLSNQTTQLEPSGSLVLIAHESAVISTMISSVLVEAGFSVATTPDSAMTLKKATELKPQALVLDVGLPGMYIFELCERLKGDPDIGSLKIVLLSSVYDMRRYKRTPMNLYGADDYIEKHHLHDLPAKLRKLLFPDQFVEAPSTAKHYCHDLPEHSRPPARVFETDLISHDGPLPTQQGERGIHETVPLPSSSGPTPGAIDKPLTPESLSLEASIFQKEEFDTLKVSEQDPNAVEKAKRFARIIVSDVALYNQETVIQGIKEGTFFELLKDDIHEGRELYERRVPAAVRKKKDYYQEAFDNFISAAKRKLEPSR